MKKSAVIIISALVFFAGAAPDAFCDDVAQNGAQKTVLKLSISEGVRMLLQNNLDIKLQQIQTDIDDAVIHREEGAFDPALSGAFTAIQSTTPLNSRSSVSAGGKRSVDAERYQFNTALTAKHLAGAEYSIEFSDISTQNSFNRFNNEYDTFAGARLKQPVYKGYGKEVNRYRIILADKDRALSLNILKQRMIDKIAEFKLAYWELVRAIEDLKVRRKSVSLAESLLDLNKKKLKASVLAPLEVTQAKAGLASRKEAVFIAQNQVRDFQNNIKLLISDDIFKMNKVIIVPTQRPENPRLKAGLEESVAYAIANRPDLIEKKTELKKQGLTIRYAQNQKLPQINLTASFGYNGLGEDFTRAIDSLRYNPEWSVGVELNIPIGNNAANNTLKIARIESRRILLETKQIEQRIFFEVDNALNELSTNKQRIDATRVSTELANAALDAEEKKFNAGLSTSHNVLQFQEELMEAKQKEITALIDYNKTFVTFLRVKGSLLEEEGIKINAPQSPRHRRSLDAHDAKMNTSRKLQESAQ